MFNKKNIILILILALVLIATYALYKLKFQDDHHASDHHDHHDHHEHDNHHDHDEDEEDKLERGSQSYEGRTEITEEEALASGIETMSAGPARIQETVQLNGTITLDPNKTAQVKARFPGIVREVHKTVGERIMIGDILASVEANDSLKIYDVKSPINGIVLSRETNPGNMAGDTPLFIISDIESVYAEFRVFHRDMKKVKVGHPVEIHCAEDDIDAQGRIHSFLPVADSESQTVVARVQLSNADYHWRAGMNVTGTVVVKEHFVPLAVKTSAIQRFRDFDVVFAKVGTTYEVRMLELGVRNDEWTQVKQGLNQHEIYVASNSFLIKADIEKSGAAHEH